MVSSQRDAFGKAAGKASGMLTKKKTSAWRPLLR